MGHNYNIIMCTCFAYMYAYLINPLSDVQIYIKWSTFADIYSFQHIK